MRALALPLFLVALGVACSAPVKEKCGPTTCAGCCDLTGTCQTASTQTCGQGGNLCTTCFGNQICSFGICVSNGGGGGTGGGTTGGGTGGGVTGGGTGGGVTGGGTGGGVTGGGTGGGVTGGGTGGGVTGGGTGGGGTSQCAQTCAGCCQGSQCITAVSTSQCGANGSTCQTCDVTRADNCDFGGCSCGSFGQCSAGQRCTGSQCVCDSTSCPTGCCQGDQCVTVVNTSTCGTAGAQCQACDSTRANNCGNGTCRCGTGAACGAGSRCFNSTCVCDSTSCANGCCSGNQCFSTVTQCGTLGGTCSTCDQTRADSCGALGCQCGSSAQCAVGVTCSGGLCGGVGRAWALRTTTGAPSARDAHAMAYLPTISRTVLFGGRSGSTRFADTWLYNGATATWTQVSGTGPTGREFPAMAYDPVHQVIVLFGGQNASSVNLNDTWTFNGTTWTNVTPASNNPPVRYFSSLVWDSARQRILLYGGYATSSMSDTWEWNGTSWTQRVLTGAPSRGAPSSAYDDVRQRLVVYGGYDTSYVNGTWELGTAWQMISTAADPGARQGPAVAYHAATQRTIMVGGSGATSFGDSWSYNGTNWVQLTPSPSTRAFSAMAYDSARSKLVLFGGDNGVADTWEY